MAAAFAQSHFGECLGRDEVPGHPACNPPAEFGIEEREGTGYMDGTRDLEDIAGQVRKKRHVDFNALDTEEDHEQAQDRALDDLLRDKEKIRKEKWLKISRDERIAVRRWHHGSNQA